MEHNYQRCIHEQPQLSYTISGATDSKPPAPPHVSNLRLPPLGVANHLSLMLSLLRRRSWLNAGAGLSRDGLCLGLLGNPDSRWRIIMIFQLALSLPLDRTGAELGLGWGVCKFVDNLGQRLLGPPWCPLRRTLVFRLWLFDLGRCEFAMHGGIFSPSII